MRTAYGQLFCKLWKGQRDRSIGTCLFVFFGKGVTSAVFLIEGKVQVPSEVLMIEVIVGRIDEGPSLMTQSGILSSLGPYWKA